MCTQGSVGLELSQERRVQSKLSWVPLEKIGAGGRELLLPISMCCVCPSLHVAGKRVPTWCLQHCIHEGTVGSLQVTDLWPQGTELRVLQKC